MKATLVEFDSGNAAVLIKAGETIPEWMQHELEDAGVGVTNPLSADLLYPATPSVIDPMKWDVGCMGSYQEFSPGDDPSSFLEG